jgi:aldehyde:ferredoxin oxidoreductase
LEKAFNCRCGIGGREEDKLGVFEHDYPSPCELPVIKREDLEKMKDDYYRLRGWDVKTGLPTRKSLEDLGLKDVADNLENQGLNILPVP